jgi:hypothetical protein
VQQSAFPGRYDERMEDAQDLYDRLAGEPAQQETPVDPNRPDFNEFPSGRRAARTAAAPPSICSCCIRRRGRVTPQSRNFLGNPANRRVLPLHNQRSPDDHGVTVCDVVDTDQASWSVLSPRTTVPSTCASPARTRQLVARPTGCGSRAIDVAAYIAAQDCKKYGINPRVIPPYKVDPPGISDHRYVTQRLKDGTHTDVGDNFPWDVFADMVAATSPTPSRPTRTPPPVVMTRRRETRSAKYSRRPAAGGNASDGKPPSKHSPNSATTYSAPTTKTKPGSAGEHRRERQMDRIRSRRHDDPDAPRNAPNWHAVSLLNEKLYDRFQSTHALGQTRDKSTTRHHRRSRWS